VRVDWPITEAAEDLARHLRYISKDIYEKGDDCAQYLEKKFFEFYGLPEMIGGRRTAASVAAQYFRRFPFITTIYVASSESRSLIRYNEYGGGKTVLLRLTAREMSKVAEANNLRIRDFKKHYMVDKNGKAGVFMFRASYSPTTPAMPPEDGKLREIKPELFWLTRYTEALHNSGGNCFIIHHEDWFTGKGPDIAHQLLEFTGLADSVGKNNGFVEDEWLGWI